MAGRSSPGRFELRRTAPGGISGGRPEPVDGQNLAGQPAMTSDDRLRLLAALEALSCAHSAEQLKACMDRELQRILPHGMAAFGIGRMLTRGGIESEAVLLHRFPGDHLQGLRAIDSTVSAALIDRWRSTRRPVIVEFEHEVGGWPCEWLRGVRPLQLRNLVWHAVCDLGGLLFTTFCFARIPGRLGPRQEWLMGMLAPHLHGALLRTLDRARTRSLLDRPLLSSQQEQLLHWLRLGKTNTEMAMILGMTESNVKYHLRQIYRRLDVSNRTQAVARAGELKLER